MKQTSVGPFFKSSLAEIYFTIYKSMTITKMEGISKFLYETPSTSVIEVRQMGFICISDPTYNKPFNDEQEW